MINIIIQYTKYTRTHTYTHTYEWSGWFGNWNPGFVFPGTQLPSACLELMSTIRPIYAWKSEHRLLSCFSSWLLGHGIENFQNKFSNFAAAAAILFLYRRDAAESWTPFSAQTKSCSTLVSSRSLDLVFPKRFFMSFAMSQFFFSKSVGLPHRFGSIIYSQYIGSII